MVVQALVVVQALSTHNLATVWTLGILRLLVCFWRQWLMRPALDSATNPHMGWEQVGLRRLASRARLGHTHIYTLYIYSYIIYTLIGEPSLINILVMQYNYYDQILKNCLPCQAIYRHMYVRRPLTINQSTAVFLRAPSAEASPCPVLNKYLKIGQFMCV